jgi:formylglycine-generating enzyme required for sulfatase activity
MTAAKDEVVGKYKLIELLGKGGFAEVHRARDLKMGREVALKLIDVDPATDPAFVERFRQEARTAASLSHPRLVHIYDFDELDGRLYLAMELVTGSSLRQLLADHAPLPLAALLPLLAQLAEALDYLHRQPLVHRDLKPANVLLKGEDPNWQVVLADFGLARSLEQTTHLTRSGATLGTPAYLAPEQAAPEKWGEITPLTDIYALGVMTYELLLGRLPFEGEVHAMLHAHAYEEPVIPLEQATEMDDDLAQFLQRALTKPPAGRFQSAGELVAALQTVLDTRARQATQQSQLAELLAQAESARNDSKWLELQRLCVAIMQRDPTHPSALQMMVEATSGIQQANREREARETRMGLYGKGQAALENEAWTEAIDLFEQVAAGNPDFKDVQALLEQARREQQLATRYSEALGYTQAEQWVAACYGWLAVLDSAPDYRDAAARLQAAVGGLLETRFPVGPDGRAAPQEDKTPAVVAETEPPLLTEDELFWEQDGKVMVRVPAGEFLYGEDKAKQTLPEYWIDKTPVTNAEYARFVQDTGHEAPKHWQGKNSPPADKADHPVVYVSWHDASAYAEWAGKRLPTEAEWEKAARGTDGRDYPWGNDPPTPELCNYGRNEGDTTPAGKYSPRGDSPCGGVDMAGNVWEWCADNFDNESNLRVLRGGSWYDDQDDARCAYRLRLDPGYGDGGGGFRLVSPIAGSES